MTLSRLSSTKPKSAPASKEQAQKKVYVLDTNVLLADPQAAVHGFAEHNVVIPGAVLEELDKIKVEHDSERGRNAREVHRILLNTFPDAASMREGVTLPSGGTLAVVIPDDLEKIATAATRAIAADLRKKDNQILLTALYVAATFPPPTILVTSDANVALKARALGIEAQDYRNEKVSLEEVREGGATEISLTTAEFQGFASKGEGAFADGSARFEHNEYCIVRSETGQLMPARASGAQAIARLRTADSIIVPGGRTVRPKNVEQQFLMDALLDPSIRLITARGPAGTGKTLLTIAAAMEQTIGKNRLYDSVLISRPVAMVGKDIGFLPGTIDDKMKPCSQGRRSAVCCYEGEPAQEVKKGEG
jgi:PhoH-like ATPase